LVWNYDPNKMKATVIPWRLSILAIYNSGPRDDYVPGDLILKLKPGVKLHLPWSTNAKRAHCLSLIIKHIR